MKMECGGSKFLCDFTIKFVCQLKVEKSKFIKLAAFIKIELKRNNS